MIPVVLDIAKGISLSLFQKTTCFPSFASSFSFVSNSISLYVPNSLSERSMVY